MKTVSVDNEDKIAILRGMLKHIKSDDTQFRSFIKQQIVNSNQTHKQNLINKEIIRRLRIQNKKLLEQVASLKDQLKQMKTGRNEMQSRLHQLVKLNNSLSGALGSCPVCWGKDQDCPACSGNGFSGWKDVNKRLFNIYILPSLDKVYRSN